MEERLQKILAQAGIGSRRKVEEFIRQGKVSIDGRVVTEMGLKLDAQQHRIQFEGRVIGQAEEKIYLLLNKPRGYLTTLDDPQGRPIVTDLLPEIKERLFPVGRLDFETEGALLLTNDGELAQRVIHPSFEVNKTYVATISGQPGRRELAMLAQGVMVEGKKTWPAQLKVLASGGANSTIEIIIHEGRKRQVRKMFAAIGYPVLHLRRVAYGNLQLGRLPLGKYRRLSKKDINQLFTGKNTLYKK